MVDLPSGTQRIIGGRFEIPVDLTEDYQVYFDVLAAPSPAPDRTAPDPHAPATFTARMPTTNLQRLFRQDISATCHGAAGVCAVDISPACEKTHAVECARFLSDLSSRYQIATRITVEHKMVDVALPVRNIGARLSGLIWRIPPQVTSIFTEDAAANGEKKKMVVYLPVAMGEPDLEYLRVEQGNFANPDTKLTEENPPPATIDFKSIMADERLNVDLARIRQTIGLCGFALEIFDFLTSHFSESGQPYAANYSEYWKAQIDAYERRCQDSRQRLKNIRFTQGDQPETADFSGLRLPELLRNLPYGEQVTSAETLLERVLRNLTLGDDFLTDDPRLTRRGYRLPLKVNPLDCQVISRIGKNGASAPEPVDTPIYGAEGKCAYRISVNFAMQELEDLGIRDPIAKNMREVLARFVNSSEAAFNIDLTATVNGVPLKFHELTGEKTGNEGCTPATQRTCVGNYGTIDDPANGYITDFFYPLQKSGSATHGDVFQRITVNKRVGRAVAFSNSIMDRAVRAVCERNYPPYTSPGEMEVKQDCLFPRSDISGEAEKYSGPEFVRHPLFYWREQPVRGAQPRIRIHCQSPDYLRAPFPSRWGTKNDTAQSARHNATRPSRHDYRKILSFRHSYFACTPRRCGRAIHDS